MVIEHVFVVVIIIIVVVIIIVVIVVVVVLLLLLLFLLWLLFLLLLSTFWYDVCFWRNSPHWARASSLTRFLDHTQRRITVGRTPLDEWSARRRDFYLATHNTRNRQTPMPPVRFEPTISAGDWPPTYALDRAATGTGFDVMGRN